MSAPPGRRRKVDEEQQYEESIKRAKTAADVQRLRLEKLMKNPDKPVAIPNPKKEWKPPQPPEFVRNVLGSSAGAGSGEYHIYRNLRKREMLRQQHIAQTSEKESLDRAYQDRVEQKLKEAEERTAKKRAKRLKRKLKAKQKSKRSNAGKSDQVESDDEDDDSDDNVSKEDPSSEGRPAGEGDSLDAEKLLPSDEGPSNASPSCDEVQPSKSEKGVIFSSISKDHQ